MLGAKRAVFTPTVLINLPISQAVGTTHASPLHVHPHAWGSRKGTFILLVFIYFLFGKLPALQERKIKQLRKSDTFCRYSLAQAVDVFIGEDVTVHLHTCCDHRP